MFQKNLQNLNQKIRLASRNILGERGGGAPIDSTFDRAKAQWLSLERSVRLLLTEVNRYKEQMKGLGDNGWQMMNTICTMFEDTHIHPPASSPTHSTAPGGAPIDGMAEEAVDPNENHPYKDVALLMKQTQAKIQQEDIAYAERHLETRLIAKLNELLVKFDALKDRLSEREKLRAEVDSLAKAVEANKAKSTSSKTVTKEGEKQFEAETFYQERKEEYTAKHQTLQREFQQYGENRLDILSALLLDFFSAQRFFAYAYGRSLFRLHEQLREADERSPIPLPNPSWQALMTYVTQTDESRQLQGGEVRPSLIMKLASVEIEERGPGAFSTPASPSSRNSAPPMTFTRPDAFASPDDVQFNPSVLNDPRNQPYLPLSIMMNLKEKRQTAEADPSLVQSASSPAEPPIRKGNPPPPLQEPAPISVSPFPDFHSSVNKEESLQAGMVWKTTRDTFGDGGPPRAAPGGPKPPPPSSAGFDLLSGSFSAPPAQPAPPPPPPAPPGRGMGGPPPPPASRQPPPPASRTTPGGFGGPPPPSPPPVVPPPRTAVSPPPPPPPGPQPPPPASRQPIASPRAVSNPFETPAFPQPPPPSSRPPPSPSHAVSPQGGRANGTFGFPAAPPPPPPPASRGPLPPPPGPPPPKPPKEWTPFDDDD